MIKVLRDLYCLILNIIYLTVLSITISSILFIYYLNFEINIFFDFYKKYNFKKIYKIKNKLNLLKQ